VLVDLIPLLDVNLEDVKEDVWELHVQLVEIHKDVEEFMFVFYRQQEELEVAEEQQEDQLEEVVEDVQQQDVSDHPRKLIVSPLFVLNVLTEKLLGEDKFWHLVLVEILVLLDVNLEDVKEDVWEEHVELVKT